MGELEKSNFVLISLKPFKTAQPTNTGVAEV